MLSTSFLKRFTVLNSDDGKTLLLIWDIVVDIKRSQSFVLLVVNVSINFGAEYFNISYVVGKKTGIALR